MTHESTVPPERPDGNRVYPISPASERSPSERRFLTRRAVAAFAALGVVLLLSVAVAGGNVLFGDDVIARWVQRTESPLGDALAAFGNWFGDTWGAGTVGLIAGALLLWRRAWWDIAFLAAIEAARWLNHWLKTLIDSPRPSEEYVRILTEVQGLGFPSGHAQTAMLIGGGALVIADRRIDPPSLRRLVTVLAIGAIGVTGYARVYSGAHWPSDVVGGYLWGFILLVLIAYVVDWAETRSERR